MLWPSSLDRARVEGILGAQKETALCMSRLRACRLLAPRFSSLGELVELRFNVGDERVQAPAANQRECVGGLLGLDLLVNVGEESI